MNVIILLAMKTIIGSFSSFHRSRTAFVNWGGFVRLFKININMNINKWRRVGRLGIGSKGVYRSVLSLYSHIRTPASRDHKSTCDDKWRYHFLLLPCPFQGKLEIRSDEIVLGRIHQELVRIHCMQSRSISIRLSLTRQTEPNTDASDFKH